MSYKKNGYFYLFVYGTLLKDLPNHYFLKSSKFICKASTVEKAILLTEGIPFLILNGESSFSTNVKGELYIVNTNTLKNIDLLEGFVGEGNPRNIYERNVIEVKDDESDKVYNAYVYTYDEIKPTVNNVLEDGNYRNFYEERYRNKNF